MMPNAHDKIIQHGTQTSKSYIEIRTNKLEKHRWKKLTARELSFRLVPNGAITEKSFASRLQYVEPLSLSEEQSFLPLFYISIWRNHCWDFCVEKAPEFSVVCTTQIHCESKTSIRCNALAPNANQSSSMTEKWITCIAHQFVTLRASQKYVFYLLPIQRTQLGCIQMLFVLFNRSH